MELRQEDSFEHWLVMYFLEYVFWIIFYPPKKLRTAALTWPHINPEQLFDPNLAYSRYAGSKAAHISCKVRLSLMYFYYKITFIYKTS